MEPLKLIKPSHIDTSQHFFNAFNNMQREVSANWIVRFCQERNNDSWESFPILALQAYYQEFQPIDLKFLINGLDEVYQGQPRYGVTLEEGHLIVHNKFVVNCYQASWKCQ